MTGINKGKLAKPRNPAGRHKGKPNRVTTEFKEAVNNLLSHAAPHLVDWLNRIAIEDPAKAVDTVAKLAEYSYPKLARVESKTEHSGKIEFAWKE